MNDFSDALSYDQQILAEKLGVADSSFRRTDDLNSNIQIAMLREELEVNKKVINALKNSNNQKENFTGGCECGNSNCTCGKPDCMKKHNYERAVHKKCKCGGHDNDSNEDNMLFGLSHKNLLIMLVVILAAFCIIQYFSYKNDTREMMQMLLTVMQSADGKGGQVSNTANIPPVVATSTATV